MPSKLHHLFKKNYSLSCLYYILYNVYSSLKRAVGNIKTISGTTHSKLSTKESLDYILEVFDDYKKIANIDKFHGKIAEIGPGDNAGVALCMIEDGCTRIDLADRFYSLRNPEQQKEIYQELLKSKSKLRKYLETCDLSDESTFPNIKRHYGQNAAAEIFFQRNSGYDFIISRSVLEHVDDPVLVLKEMFKALKPGGKLIHKVDLKDHGMFSNHFHELKFFEISDFLYQLMTYKSGYPNRVLINQYRDTLDSLGCQYKLFVTQLARVGPIIPQVEFNKISKTKRDKALDYIRQYKAKFALSLKHLDEKDLVVSGFFLVATKK